MLDCFQRLLSQLLMFEEYCRYSVEFDINLKEQPQAGEEVNKGCRMATAFVEDCTCHKVRTGMAEIGLEGGKEEILQWNPKPKFLIPTSSMSSV